MSERRGWRERVEPGLYRSHAPHCPRSGDRKAGGRCSCPHVLVVPGDRPGKTRQVSYAGTVTQARAAPRRTQAGRTGRCARSSRRRPDAWAWSPCRSDRSRTRAPSRLLRRYDQEHQDQRRLLMAEVAIYGASRPPGRRSRPEPVRGDLALA